VAAFRRPTTARLEFYNRVQLSPRPSFDYSESTRGKGSDMFWHDIRLAWQGIRRSPLICALIVAVMAIGIGTSTVAITLYHAKAGNPIWWKNDVLFRVMLDSRPDAPLPDGCQRWTCQRSECRRPSA
jgi:hypothetical protein